MITVAKRESYRFNMKQTMRKLNFRLNLTFRSLRKRTVQIPNFLGHKFCN